MPGGINRLIGYYGMSLTGRSHHEQMMPCQDSHLAVRLTNDIWLAAVADGVGSAEFSDRGSKTAVNALFRYCSGEIIDCDNWLQVLAEGYTAALEAIRALAEEEGNSIHDYDTTLTAALFDGGQVVYGQSGDSGMIGMNQDGRYELLTLAQKGDAFNEVCPLRCGSETWVFAKLDKKFSGLLLMTDGVLDVAVPALLNDQPEKLYVNFVRQFLSSEQIGTNSIDQDMFRQKSIDFLESPFCNAITDDMTVLSIWNNKIACSVPDADYFLEPDWAALRRSRYNKLYPYIKPDEVPGADDSTK